MSNPYTSIRVLDENFNTLFEEERMFSNLEYNQQLKGIGYCKFDLPAGSLLEKYVQTKNAIQLVQKDSGSEAILFTGIPRPTPLSELVSTIVADDYKSLMRFKIFPSNGSLSRVSDLGPLLNSKGITLNLNQGDVPFSPIDYSFGGRFIDTIEQVSQITGFNWSLERDILTFGKVGGAPDISLTNQIGVSATGNIRSVANIGVTVGEQFDAVYAKGDGGASTTVGSGKIEVSYKYDTSNLTTLTELAQKHLEEKSGQRIYSFDVLEANGLSIGDEVDVNVSQGTCPEGELFEFSGSTTVLKKDVKYSGGKELVTLSVSDVVTSVPDKYNYLSALERRVTKLES